MVDLGWARQRFESAFKRATSGIVEPDSVVFVQDSELPYRAITSWDKDGGRWRVRYRPDLCPNQETGMDIREFVRQVAVHEACHVMLHGSRLRLDMPIEDAEAGRLEMAAARCAVAVIASWKQDQ
jgi:hypothetical protein